MDLYRDEILEHYRHPHNFGDLPKANAVYEEYNPLCGDRLRLQLEIENGKLINVGFIGEGCAISTASASMMTDYLQGKKVDEIRGLKGEEALRIVGMENISPGRLRCALLVLEALRGALKAVSS